MAQTMAEKLLSRHNLAGALACAGDIIEARIDGAMCHYHAAEPMHDLALQAGFKDGLPRVWVFAMQSVEMVQRPSRQALLAQPHPEMALSVPRVSRNRRTVAAPTHRQLGLQSDLPEASALAAEWTGSGCSLPAAAV